jgi:uncharacterized membrane protein YeaQ/YmgE (transglycosylase-associated protein family)
MGCIGWIVIGGLTGWLASIVMKTNAQMGIVANVVVGCVGAWLGGWLAATFGIVPAGIGTYVVAVVGAIILIAILRALGMFK